MIPKRLLIDGDILAYKAVFQETHEVNWGNDLWGNQTDVAAAIRTYDLMVHRIVRDNFPEDVEIIHFFSAPSGSGWRKDFYPAYKDNRLGKLPVAGLAALKNHYLDSEDIDARMSPRLEADDLMGITATADPSAVIVSEDKDMATLPAWWFNPAKHDEPTKATKEQADRALFIQAMTGDTTDGYPGCPRLGAKTAPKVLLGKDPRDFWEYTLEAFEKAGKDEEFARSQVLCARILRDGDWDFDKEEMTWRP